MDIDGKIEFVSGINTMSEFRTWCENTWQEHLVEKESFGEPVTYTRVDYFRKNKYFLKSQYKQYKG